MKSLMGSKQANPILEGPAPAAGEGGEGGMHMAAHAPSYAHVGRSNQMMTHPRSNRVSVFKTSSSFAAARCVHFTKSRLKVTVTFFVVIW
jgi:hypothetical protein